MRLFTSHKLIKDSEGYIVVLYLDKHLTEFAREISGAYGHENRSLDRGAIDYIKERLPEVKVNRVNIMLGSLKIASLSFGNGCILSQEHGG